MLSDMAVSHPQAGVGDVEEDVDRLPGWDEHGVGPDEVGLDNAAASQGQEAACSVDVEGIPTANFWRWKRSKPQTDLVLKDSARWLGHLPRSPTAHFLCPRMTKRMHSPWFVKPNRLQPSSMHWSLLVGNGLTATPNGRSPAATVAGVLG
jgi:hypothetical protein